MTPTFSYGTLVSTPTGTHSQTASPHFTADIMQNSKNKEALRLAEWLEKPEHDGSVCAEHIESATELRRMHAENETLRAGYDAARDAAQAAECGNCFEGKSDMDHDCRKCGGTGAAQPLTDEALDLMCEQALFGRISMQQFARSIESVHGIR